MTTKRKTSTHVIKHTIAGKCKNSQKSERHVALKARLELAVFRSNNGIKWGPAQVLIQCSY
jgi:hypothetical protein